MKHILVLSAFIALFAVSCKEDKKEHLTRFKMQQVLFDIYLAESYSTFVPKDSALRKTEKNLDSLAIYYQRIFKSHNITPRQFEESMSWYKEHPEELDSIYTRLIPESSRGFTRRWSLQFI
jgi:hypothetical protein